MRSKNDGAVVMASAEDDRTRWDERHRGQAPCIAPPIGVGALADVLPTSGRALDVAYVSQHTHMPTHMSTYTCHHVCTQAFARTQIYLHAHAHAYAHSPTRTPTHTPKHAPAHPTHACARVPAHCLSVRLHARLGTCLYTFVNIICLFIGGDPR